MGNNSVIEHRANYYHVRVEEDFISICREGKASPHCKALILSILEHWTNTKRDKGEKQIIYMTYALWQENMYCLFGRNMIIMSLQELENEGLIKKHPHITPDNKDTYAYSLNVDAVQSKLKGLPEKGPDDTRPNSNAFKNKRVLKQTHLKKDETPVPNQTKDAFKKGRNVSSTTQLQNITSKESTIDDSAKLNTLESSDSTPSLSSLLAEFEKLKKQNEQLTTQVQTLTAQISGDTNVPNTPSPTTSTRSTPPVSSSVRDNPSTEHADTSLSLNGVEDKQDVEQKSIQDKQSNLIARETTEEKRDIVELAIRDTKTSVSGEQKQETLFEIPDSIAAIPSESMPWSVEKLVQITEAKRFVKDNQGTRHQGERFSEKVYGKSGKSQRDRQKEAAKKIIDLGIMEEQYIMAYDDRNDEWWNDKKGSLTVETMIAKTPRNIIRVIEVLEEIENKGSSRIISFQDRQPKQPATTSTKSTVTAKVDKSISDKNLEDMLSKVAAMQGVM